jgi:DHA2 family multidrug resistance protein
VTKGFSGPDAATAAQGYSYQQFQHQVSLLSFMDCFRVIAWLTLAAVPLLLFVRRFKPAGKAPAAHYTSSQIGEQALGSLHIRT